MHKNWLEKKDFDFIYNKVPRLNIDVVIMSDDGIILSRRTIEPNLGCWHLPGGTVYKEETISDATKRIVKKETGLDVDNPQILGYMEFLSEKRGDINVHTISIVMKVVPVGGKLVPDNNASETMYFKQVPSPIIKEHGRFLKDNNILN